MFHLSRKNVI